MREAEEKEGAADEDGGEGADHDSKDLIFVVFVVISRFIFLKTFLKTCFF